MTTTTAMRGLRVEYDALVALLKAKRAKVGDERLRADGWWYRKTGPKAKDWKKVRRDGATSGSRITDPARMLPHMDDSPAAFGSAARARVLAQHGPYRVEEHSGPFRYRVRDTRDLGAAAGHAFHRLTLEQAHAAAQWLRDREAQGATPTAAINEWHLHHAPPIDPVDDTVDDFLNEHGIPGGRRRKARAAARPAAAPTTTPDDWSSPYFKSAAAEAIFRLTQLDGQARKAHLGITLEHFTDPEKAKAWRDRLAKIVHPDRTDHPAAAAAMAKLNEMYEFMTEDHRERSQRRAESAHRARTRSR